MALRIDERAKQDAAMLRATALRLRRLAVEHPEDAEGYRREAAQVEARIVTALPCGLERAA